MLSGKNFKVVTLATSCVFCILLSFTLVACYTEPTHYPDTDDKSVLTQAEEIAKQPTPDSGVQVFSFINNEYLNNITNNQPQRMAYMGSRSGNSTSRQVEITDSASIDEAVRLMSVIKVNKEILLEDLDENNHEGIYLEWADGYGYDLSFIDGCLAFARGDGEFFFYECDGAKAFLDYFYSRSKPL